MMRAVPTYDYDCRSCGNRIEVIHSMRDDGPSACEVCGGPLKRVLYPTGIIFKGSGFYSTDSRSGSSSDTARQGKPATADSPSESTSAPRGDGNAVASTPAGASDSSSSDAGSAKREGGSTGKAETTAP